MQQGWPADARGRRVLIAHDAESVVVAAAGRGHRRARPSVRYPCRSGGTRSRRGATACRHKAVAAADSDAAHVTGCGRSSVMPAPPLHTAVQGSVLLAFAQSGERPHNVIERPAAIAADEMVVVVTDPRFEERGGAAWRDAAVDARPMESTHDVVDGPRRERADPCAGSRGDSIHGHGSGQLRQHSEQRDPRCRHARRRCARNTETPSTGEGIANDPSKDLICSRKCDDREPRIVPLGRSSFGDGSLLIVMRELARPRSRRFPRSRSARSCWQAAAGCGCRQVASKRLRVRTPACLTGPRSCRRGA
jgi:hypothetical protein